MGVKSFLQSDNPIIEGIKEQTGITVQRLRHGNETALSDGGPNLVFPEDLGGGTEGMTRGGIERPYIRFGCHSADATKIFKHICLPCPPGIQFTDGAEYTSISMGKIAAIADITRAGMEGYESGGAFGAIGGVASSARDQLTSGGATGAAILAARQLGADSIAQALEFTTGKTINPRMNTAFTGNTLRTFSFGFKLIGSSVNEVNTIQQIQQYFQEQVYAQELGGQKVMLKYPNQWRIQFMDPNGGELTHIPKIYTSYLTSCSTQINSSSATFRKDMSPYEVDVSLSFQETKVLTRDELHKLNVNGDRENRDTASNKENFKVYSKIVDHLIDRAVKDKNFKAAFSGDGTVTWEGTNDAVLARQASEAGKRDEAAGLGYSGTLNQLNRD